MSPIEALTLLSPAQVRSQFPSCWADLGAGSGVFTQALASLLEPGSKIYAVDRHAKIRAQTTPNQVSIVPVKADFSIAPLPFRDLEGILMANSLHYIKDKLLLIRSLRTFVLRTRHVFLIVEYDTDRATPIWVPYPVSFSNLVSLFQAAGYSTITRLAEHPSIYNRNKIYAAYIS